MTYIKTVTIGVVVILCITGVANGQNPYDHQGLFVQGITADLGLGKYSGRDEVVSKNVYSGRLPYIAVRWSRLHTTYGYRVSLVYRQSSDIANYSLPAEVTQFSMASRHWATWYLTSTCNRSTSVGLLEVRCPGPY